MGTRQLESTPSDLPAIENKTIEERSILCTEIVSRNKFLSLIRVPRQDLHKVRNERRHRTLQNGTVAADRVLLVDVGVVILRHHCYIYMETMKLRRPSEIYRPFSTEFDVARETIKKSSRRLRSFLGGDDEPGTKSDRPGPSRPEDKASSMEFLISSVLDSYLCRD